MLYMLKLVRLTLVCTCCLEDVEKGMYVDFFQIFSVIKVESSNEVVSLSWTPSPITIAVRNAGTNLLNPACTNINA
jgi:hypothetical protein